jgi:ADP-ribose pyrophosphatase YjhB (NUDIX family)
VAGALIERDGCLLLVRNQRRGGRVDWSPPGGVIDPTDGSVTEGLAREVLEETHLVVTEWDGPLYEVRTRAPDMGWSMRVEVHRAAAWHGQLHVDDPDGIVTDALFVPVDEIGAHLDLCPPWVREPLAEWLADRWEVGAARGYGFEVHGPDHATARIVRMR